MVVHKLSYKRLYRELCLLQSNNSSYHSKTKVRCFFIKFFLATFKAKDVL